MKKTTLSIGAPIELRDLLSAFSHFLRPGNAEGEFQAVIGRFSGKESVYFVNSGTTAFYVILQALKKLHGGNEVILPAYTAPSLVLPIKKAGLKTVLCDISMETHNMNLAALSDAISSNTLCVVPVHMFGLPLDMPALVNLCGNHSLFVVEDAASSMGSCLKGRQTGTFGDVGFFSFNRGKNFTTFSGGCIVTDDQELEKAIEDECSKLDLPSKAEQALVLMKLALLYLAFKPGPYTLLKGVVSKFKYQHLHQDFSVSRYNEFQAALGLSLWRKTEDMFGSRTRNSMYLLKALEGKDHLRLPRWPDASETVFNQFPIVLEDPNVRDSLHLRLNAQGIESTVLYPYPVHLCYDIGYERSEDLFPNAAYLSKRLLLIPVHPLVKRKALDKAIQILESFPF